MQEVVTEIRNSIVTVLGHTCAIAMYGGPTLFNVHLGNSTFRFCA